MPPFLNHPSGAIVLPLRLADSILVFRADNYSQPLYIKYGDLLNAIKGQIQGGSSFITNVDDTDDIALSVLSGILSAALTETGVAPGEYGDSTHVPKITVDDKGRITNVELVAIAGSGSGTVTSVGAGTGMSFTTITASGNVSIDTSKVPYLSSGFSTGLLKWNGSSWVFDNSAYITSAALSSYLTIAAAALTYYPLTNPSGYLNAAAAGALFYPLGSNPAGYLTSASISGLVPYTGATGDVGLGAFNLTAAKLNTTAATALGTAATLFAVIDGGEIKTRTPAQVLSDIGAASSTGVPYMCMQESYPVATNQTGILYVPSAGKIYVCNISSNSVSIINLSTGLVSTVSVTGAFQAFYIASINEVWITSNSLTTINRISVSLNTLLTAMTGATINGTDYVEVSSTSVLICNNNATGSISPVNPSTLTIGAPITTNVPANPQGMALNTNVASSQYNKIVISAGAGVAIFDPTTNAITTTVANPSSAVSSGSRIRYITSTNQYILANFGASNILVLDIASATTFTLNSSIRNLPGVLDVAVDETAGYVFTCITGLTSAAVLFVSIIDLATKKVVNTLATNVLSGSATTSGRIALDTTNKKYYVCGRSSNTNVVTTIKYV